MNENLLQLKQQMEFEALQSHCPLLKLEVTWHAGKWTVTGWDARKRPMIRVSKDSFVQVLYEFRKEYDRAAEAGLVKA